MKRKRRAPRRYLLTWRGKDLGWYQELYARRPMWVGHRDYPCRLEDLLTGEILVCNFDLRQETLYATRDWKVRDSAKRAIDRFYNPPPKKPVDRLAKLRGDETRWIRKFKLAQTKLRKIRAAIKRQLKRHDHEHTSPAGPGA